jgi:hypothetical protein
MLYMKQTDMQLYEADRYAVTVISRSFILRIKSVSDKFVEKITTHILC